MLKNYIKIAWRILLKNKKDSVISIGGLALGLACCILLVLYVRFEWSFDDFHDNADNLYHLTEEVTYPSDGSIHKFAFHPYQAALALKNDIPEIESITAIAQLTLDIRHQNNFHKEKINFVSSEFLNDFSFPLLYGNAASVLDEKNNVVITEAIAKKYFGTSQAIGKDLNIRANNSIKSYTVAGITKEIPKNSSIQFDILLPFDNYFSSCNPAMADYYKNEWASGFCNLWVKLNKESSVQAIEAKFPEFLEKHMGNLATNQNMKMHLEPLSKVHFNTEVYNPTATNAMYTIILGVIAAIILIIAGINFVSLRLSQTDEKMKEIAVRRSIGAFKKQIGFQIYGEIFLHCALSLILGVLMASIFSSSFEVLIGKQLEMKLWADPVIWLSILGLLLFLTIITGIYPAIHISRKTPASFFSEHVSSTKTPDFIKSLVVFQFSLSIIFLILSFIMKQQVSFMLNKDLGYNTSNIVAVNFNPEIERANELATLFVNELKKLPAIENASIVSGSYKNYDMKEFGFGMGGLLVGSTIPGLGQGIKTEVVDENYLKTMNIKLLQGENFSKEKPVNLENGILVNKKFAEAIGLENPVGEVLQDKNDDGWTPLFDGKKIIGVVDNYHFNSLFNPLEPIALKYINTEAPSTVLVQLNSETNLKTLTAIEDSWKNILPEESFSFNFLDQLVQHQYQQEIRWSKILNASTIIAMLLACFGIFSMVSYSLKRRLKEIGIRKVFGASVNAILKLITWDLLKLILISIVIATPLAYYIGEKWLQDFAYRINLSVWQFILSAFITIAIAFITISFKSIKAALQNPVKSLRSE
ncbi:ABC transporter permease [Zunongwangia atlantica]|uniref:ABC transporter permease n=1 Tax=Zunongwangia atlantica 22II14-10F7 TaxID=1185767 RepID=A0A1Y1T1I8_9FLAO|nr:ABC transporter permease [Zunongwangia atlantica]ORL44876.1 hypothetical protein IIF7_13757 [Zunongwangia atlantica 22II14-10F7]